MSKKYVYKTQGTCSTQIDIEIEDDRIVDVAYTRGCDGNLKGIGRLTKGMEINDVIERLAGTQCKNKGTSCPDQLARALTQIREGKLAPAMSA